MGNPALVNEIFDEALPVDGCFLCHLPERLVYDESDHFIAMLGLGPVIEGYSLIAAREHAPSMLDLPPRLVLELTEFTRRVRARVLVPTRPKIRLRPPASLC